MTRAIRLTRRGRGVFLSGCALLLLGVSTDNPVALAAGVFAIAVCGSALAWVGIRRRGVRICRMAPPGTSTAGSDLRTTATITVDRAGFGPALVRNLTPADQDHGGSMVRLDRAEVLVQRACVAQRRGLLEWPRIDVVLPDPLGIAVGFRQAASSGRTVVYPQSVPLGHGPARTATGNADLDRGASGRHWPDDPGPVPRGYQPGDEFRRMHWPATARAGEPMVRAEEPHAARTAVIAIDCAAGGYSDPEAFERSVTACASIADWLLDEGWSISVQTAGGRPLADSPWLLGPHGRHRIMTALAMLQLDSSEAAAPPSLGDVVIVIHGAHHRIWQPTVISLSTEDDGRGAAMWDGIAPLSGVWAAATRQGALA